MRRDDAKGDPNRKRQDDAEETSEQIALPLIDTRLKARFQRSRERRIGRFLALFEKVLLSETVQRQHL
jgi:hypothetical protein